MGDNYNKDNYAVFQVLQRWTTGGTAATYDNMFASTNNGRLAFLNLLAIYEGIDACQSIVQQVKKVINHTYYA